MNKASPFLGSSGNSGFDSQSLMGTQSCTQNNISLPHSIQDVSNRVVLKRQHSTLCPSLPQCISASRQGAITKAFTIL